MIDPEELAICKRRGHHAPCLHTDGGWSQCEYCGMWLRERLVKDEREDEPPEEEIDRLIALNRRLSRAASKD